MAVKLIAFLCVAALSHSCLAAPVRYAVTDLGVLPGFRASGANAVNKQGQVTGELAARTGTTCAFLYSAGVLKNIGGLGSPAHRAKGYGISSSGAAINDQGQVTGWAYVDDQEVHAFLYQQRKMRDLGTLTFFRYGEPDEWVGSRGSAINDQGQISGVSNDADGYGRAFLYSRGHMSNLGMPPGKASDRLTVLQNVGLNEQGDMAIVIDGPYHSILDGPYHSGETVVKSSLYFHKKGKFHRIATLSHPAFFLSIFLNNHGTIAGTYYDNGKNQRARGFQVIRGKISGIGFLRRSCETEIRAINNPGQIIGTSRYPIGEDHAFLYSSGKMRDLNNLIPPDSGWVLEEAHGINDRGQIVGTGTHNGQTRAFVLTPP